CALPILFPAFACVAWRLRERPGVALIGATLGLTWLYAVFERLAGFPLTQATIHWGALRIVPCFAYGCAAYLAWRGGGLSRPGLFALPAVALVLAGAGLRLWDGLIVSLFGVLILGLAGLSGRGGPMESRPAVWLGEVSYSVYMVCVPWKLLAVNGAARLTGGAEQLPPWLWLLVVAAIVPLAGLSYHLVEKPARGWMRGLALRRTRARAAAAAVQPA